MDHFENLFPFEKIETNDFQIHLASILPFCLSDKNWEIFLHHVLSESNENLQMKVRIKLETDANESIQKNGKIRSKKLWYILYFKIFL